MFFLFASCGGNSAWAPHKVATQATVMAGRLANADVEIFLIENDGSLHSQWKEKTSSSQDFEEIGKFNAHIRELKENRFYLYKVTGGEDWDVDQDGIKDDKPTPNRGTLRAIATEKDFKTAGEYFNITVVSEMLYESVAKHLVYFKSERLKKDLTQQVKNFIKDVDNDGDIDKNDMLTFNPVTDKNRLVSLYKYKLPKIVRDVHDDKVILLDIDKVIGQVKTNGTAENVILSRNGEIAYVSNYDKGIAIVDVSDLEKPVIKNIFNIDGDVKDLVLSDDGERLYIVDYQHGLRIYGLQSPFDPELQNSYLPSNASAYGVTLAKDGKRVYLATTNGLMVINVEYSSQLYLENIINSGEWIHKVTLSKDGRTAFFTSESLISYKQHLVIEDISDPKKPLLKNNVELYIGGNIVCSNDKSKLYILNDMGNLVIVNIKKPEYPIQVKELKMYGNTYSIAISKDGKKLYIANGLKGILVLDITHPDNPAVIGNILTDGEAKGLLLSKDEQIAFVSNGESGLSIVDITHPESPTILGSLNTFSGNDDKGGIALSPYEKYVYVTNYDDGISIINIEDPEKPTIAGRISGQCYYPFNLALSPKGDKIFTVDDCDSLKVADVSNPLNPKILTDPENPDIMVSAREIVLSRDGQRAYVPDGDLIVVDIRNAQNMNIIKRIATNGGARDVALSKNEKLAYVASGENGLAIVDIQNSTILANMDLNSGNDWAELIIISQEKNIAYIGSDHRIFIVDISNLDHLTTLATIDIEDTDWYDIQGITLSRDSNTLYIAAGDLQKLIVVNVSNPNDPKILHSFAVNSRAMDVILSKDQKRAYVSTGYGLVIIGLNVFQ